MTKRLISYFKRAPVIALAMLLVLSIASFGVARATLSDDASTTSSIDNDGIIPGGGGGGNVNNEVVVTNTVDGRFAHRSGSGVALVTGDTAENQNAAAATSSCSDCRTVAVATQIVLVQRTDASTISPRNIAIALNVGCVRCETFAAAYQYVVTTDGLVRFTPAARQQMAAIEGQIRDLAGTDGLAFPDLEAQIDVLVEQLWALVDEELVRVGVPGEGNAYKDTDQALNDASPTASPTETASPSAEPSSSPSGDEAREEESPTTDSTDPSEPSPSETPQPTPTDS